jgi:hypothetical protein
MVLRFHPKIAAEKGHRPNCLANHSGRAAEFNISPSAMRARDVVMIADRVYAQDRND